MFPKLQATAIYTLELDTLFEINNEASLLVSNLVVVSVNYLNKEQGLSVTT